MLNVSSTDARQFPAETMISANNHPQIRSLGKYLVCLMLFVVQPMMAAAPGALADASMHGDLATMKSLLKAGADPNEAGQFGTPALHWRIDRDDLPAAKLLL